MADLKPGRGADQFPLRLPEGMREQLKRAAESSGRSMNAEIIGLLEFALSQDREKISDLWSILNQQNTTINDLTRRNEEWRSLFQAQLKNKNGFVSLLKSLCHQVLSAEDEVPKYLSDLAKELLIITNTNLDDVVESIDVSAGEGDALTKPTDG